MDHALVYSSALCMFFLATAVLFVCNLKLWKSHLLNPQFFAYVLIMASILSDAVWIFLDGNPKYIFWNYLLNIIEYSTFGIIGYCWIIYCLPFFPFAWCKQKKVRNWLALPAALVTFLVVTSCITGWVFTVDESACYQRGPYFFIQQTGYLYLILTSVLAIMTYRKSTLASQRQHMLTITMFAVPPTVLGIAQLMLPPAAMPTLQFSIFISLMLVYIDEQNRKITCDSLTSLCNRYRFEQVFNEKMVHLRRNGRPGLYLLMGDLDRFKDINDNFGHLEGDRVLQTVGNLLDDIGREYDATVARMSGDEFCVLINADDDEAPNAYRDNVYRALAAITRGKPYKVTISFGVIKCRSSQSVAELIAAVDTRMYQEKRGKSRRV